MRLVLASENPHKLRELSVLLAPHELLALPPGIELPPETGATFEENARVKARAAARATRLPAVADDSGIEAAALGGAPGVRSARFAGEGASDAENLAELLRALLEHEDRSVAYVCALVIAGLGGDEASFAGRCEGRLSWQPRGSGGFGYDPAFLPSEIADARTMAELSQAEKDAISHRGRAARALRNWLDDAEAGG